MKKSALVFSFAAFLSVSALAQSVQEGVNNLYAQRYASAKAVFDKLLASNPNNIEATYWLGQDYIAQNDVKSARSLYEKALMSNGNAPLLLAGIGNVELLEGKAQEARAHFEQAIAASKGKKGADPAVLTAVGRANVNAYNQTTRLGDLNYAVTRLTEASQQQPNNPDILLNLGNAYRKMGSRGGDAIQAYRQALQVSPNFAAAPYMAAKVYKSQVSYRDPNAWGAVLENLNAAVAADPKFAPAYEELYYYNLFSKKDYNAAENLARQIVANSDQSVENNYWLVQTQIVQKNYPAAIETAKSIISGTNNNPRPRVYRALAVSYMGNKDTASACTYINEFLNKASDEDLLSSDYIIHAQSCGRTNPNVVREDVFRAISMDSVLSRQLKTLNEFIDDAKAGGNRVFEAELRMISYQLRQSKGAATSPTELISYMAVPFYLGGAYQRADSISQEYSKLAPDSIYGYYWSALSEQAMDTGVNMKGTFVNNYQKVLDIASTDTVRYKTQGVKAATSLAIYYVNVKKDVNTGLSYVNKGLSFDATNANLNSFKQALSPSKQPANRQSASTTPTQRTNTSSNSAKDTKTKSGGTKTKQ